MLIGRMRRWKDGRQSETEGCRNAQRLPMGRALPRTLSDADRRLKSEGEDAGWWVDSGPGQNLAPGLRQEPVVAQLTTLHPAQFRKPRVWPRRLVAVMLIKECFQSLDYVRMRIGNVFLL